MTRLRRLLVRAVSAAVLAGFVVAAPVAPPSGAEQEVLQELVTPQWEVVGQLDSPVATGQVVPLSNGRALLTGLAGRDLRRVELYEPGIGFRRVADAPAPLLLHFAVTLQDGRVLVGGGGDAFDRNTVTDRAFIYDPPSNAWSEAAPLPAPTFFLYSNPSVLLRDGRVMISGGGSPEAAYPGNLGDFSFDLYVASRRVFLFDPSGATQLPGGSELEGVWTEGAPMPATRIFTTHAPNFIAKGPGVQIGAPRSAGRSGHAMVMLSDGRVLVIGGREYAPGDFYGVSMVDTYDPTIDRWTRGADLPSVPSDGDGGYGGRGFPAVSALEGGHILIAGGLSLRLVEERKADGRVKFDLEGNPLPRGSSLLLDPRTGAFHRAGDLRHRRVFPLAASWQEGGGAFILGGSTVEGGPMPVGEYFDPASRRWVPLPSEPEPTSLDVSPRMGTLLSDGSVLTWSSLPFEDEPPLGSGGMRAVKRLHPAGR